MQVDFPPELEEKLNQIAAEQGENIKSLVREAVERLVGYDDWFVTEVERGIVSADEGKFVEHADVLAMVKARYPGAKN